MVVNRRYVKKLQFWMFVTVAVAAHAFLLWRFASNLGWMPALATMLFASVDVVFLLVLFELVKKPLGLEVRWARYKTTKQ